MKQDKNKDLKIKFLEYYAILPIQKLAADYIAKDEDTITNWKKDDSEFSDRMSILKSEWAQRTTKRVRNPEWLLERITREHFKENPKEIDVNVDGLIIIKDHEDKPE